MITPNPPLPIFLLATLSILAVICLRPSDVMTQGSVAPTHADILRGKYARYRANNDLLYYYVDVRVDPNRRFLSGSTQIRFKMLKDDNRIQLDLHEALKVDKLELNSGGSKSKVQSPKTDQLNYTRDSGALFVGFPQTLKSGQTYEIQVYYSGYPLEQGRFGGIAFKKDPAGRPWVNTACEGEGASVWWPNKDQWRDEVESMKISVSIPNDLG